MLDSRWMNRVIGALLLNLVWVCLTARLHGQKLEYLRHQSWSTEQGLPYDSVNQVFQTENGFLWVATERGVARFDGVNFTTFDHKNEAAFVSDDACCLAGDRKGDLWIGTADGLLRVHGEHFERFGEGKGLPSSTIRGLVSDPDGSVLVLTAAGLVAWTGERFAPVKQAPANVDAMGPAGGDGTWLLSGGRVYLLRAGVVSVYVPTNRWMAHVAGMAVGPDGTMWSFSSTAVEAVGKGMSREWKVGGDLPGSRVESISIDRGGKAWVGTNDGVAVLSGESQEVTPIASLRGNAVLETFEDREGDYWIASEASGLHELRFLKFRTNPELANQAVKAIVQTGDGAVWIGTRKDGLRRVRGAVVDEPARQESLTSPFILSLAGGADGSVWVGTPDGLNHVSSEGRVQRITSVDGLPDDYVQALAEGADGSLWIGTRHGLVRRRGEQMQVLSKKDGLGGDLIGTLLPAKNGDLWVGTSGGLSRVSRDGRIANYGAGVAMAGGIISALAEEPGGTIWIATADGGLLRNAGGEFRRVKVSVPGEPEYGPVYGMVADSEGFLWLRRERSIARASVRELTQCAVSGSDCSSRVQDFTGADGIPSEELVAGGSPVLWRMADGEIWSATRRGVAITDPEELPLNRVPPGVAIEGVKVDDTAVSTSQAPVSVPFGPVRLTIEYAGLSFVVPSEVRYRYKLEGFDRSWTEAGNRRSATYTNLRPGSYRFRVQARNNDGVWNEGGATISFRIVPPFYRRWWFIALLVLCVGGVAAGLYRLRLRRLRMQFEAVLRERNRIAREIHDTLAQDFVGVSLQLEMISQLLGRRNVEAVAKQVEQTKKLVTEGLADARQSIWELRANTGQESLPARLGETVQRYSGEPLVVRTKIGGAFRPLDSRVENEVLRVAQEALSNVQRHSDATSVQVELYYGTDQLVLTIQDNGRGFVVEDALRMEGRYGLSGLKERAGSVGGTLEIASRPGEGATIRMTTRTDSGKGRTLWPNRSR